MQILHLHLGYPKRGDQTRTLRRRWRGIAKERVLHEEFGPVPVDVFVIDVGSEP